MADPRNIYKYLLFLPILVPLLFAPLLYFALEGLGEKLGLVVIIIFYSGIIGGIPYLILGVGLAFWMRHKSEAEIRKALLLSPLIMAGLTAILILPFVLVSGGNQDLFSLNGFTGMIGVLAIFIGIFGYTYVGITFALARLYRGHAFEAFPK